METVEQEKIERLLQLLERLTPLLERLAPMLERAMNSPMGRRMLAANQPRRPMTGRVHDVDVR